MESDVESSDGAVRTIGRMARELLLTLDGPITPLVITAPSARSVSLLMPVRAGQER